MFTAESIGIAVGLALALGIFAFKTAVGEYYFLAVVSSRAKRAAFLAVTLTMYAVLFAAAFAVLETFDLFRFAGDSMKFLQAGTLLHVLLCAGLLAWGVRLLGRRDDEALRASDSRGWLLLAVPCPVCMAAVFLVCAFARMLFPEAGHALRFLVPGFFLAANLGFLLALWGAGKLFALRPLRLTGGVMIFIALYFLLILLVAPQLQNVGKLYSAAVAAGSGPALSWRTVAVMLIPCIALSAGFLLEARKRKER
mgnify:CR=1 FL=1